ncbi:MAG: hypothetical protein FWB78_03550 [Treponema sp.]|nr:hypothetical protein [Treponema sp.]
MSKAIRKGQSWHLIVVFSILVLVAPVSLGAYDFGVILNQNIGLGGIGNNTNVDYEAALVPRFSALLGDYGEIHVSASLKMAYANESWGFVPELLRTEFFWNFGDADLSLGRILFADPMNLVAAGLFDGARFARHTAMGTFGVGIWYTGLLYKNRTRISMTSDDEALQATELDWSNFADTYFASRRLMAALYWEHPSVAEMFRLDVALIGQVDLNNRDSAYHSQYLIAKAAMPFQRFIFELGGAMEIAQEVGDGETNLYIALAGDIGLHWMPPAPFHNMLSFTGRFTSGRAESGSMSAFVPITAIPHGDILEADIPGLSVLSLNYTARLHRTFSTSLAVSHFVRSDSGTFTAYPLDESSNNFFLGTELFARFIWSPVSDMSFNLGAGAFLPALGDVAPNADPLWRVRLVVTLALF